MLRARLVIIGLLVVLTSVAATDRYGDPLPPGAVARLGTVRYRTGSAVRTLAALPDGKSLLTLTTTSNSDSQITLMDLETGKVNRRFTELPFVVRTSSLVGNTLAWVGWEGRKREPKVYLADVTTGKRIPFAITQVGNPTAVALSPDGRSVALASEGGHLMLWDAIAQTELRSFTQGEDTWLQIVFSPDGKVLATGSGKAKGAIRLWDVSTGKERHSLPGPRGGLPALAFSPNGNLLATSASDERQIRLWDPASGKLVREWGTKLGTQCLTFSPDSTTLATGDFDVFQGNNRVCYDRLWDVATGKEIRRFSGQSQAIGAQAFTPDGSKLISAANSLALRVYDVKSGKILSNAEAHDGQVMTLAYSHDGKLLATGGIDRVVRLWEPTTGKPIRVLTDPGMDWVSRVAFSVDGRTLASAGFEGVVRFWDAGSGKEVGQLEARMPKDEFVGYSPDGRILATANRNVYGAKLRFWDTATKKELPFDKEINTSGFPPNLFSPDGKQFATVVISEGFRQSVVRVYETSTRKEIRKWDLPLVTPVGFIPDSQTLVGVEPGNMGLGRLHFLDLTNGNTQAFQPPEGLRAYSGGFSLATSPDGRLVAYGTPTGAIVLWEVVGGGIRRVLSGHQGPIGQMAFSPDGTRLASASYDTTGLVWDVTGLVGLKRDQALSRKEMAKAWDDLVGDASVADKAILALATAKDVVGFLKEKVRAPGVEDRAVRKLVAQLDSDRAAEREQAYRALADLGETAYPALRAALADKPSAEVRRRGERLLRQSDWPRLTGERLRTARAVEVLERSGGGEAKKVLEALATDEARRALVRMK